MDKLVTNGKNKGNVERMIYTQRDIDMIRFIARWWCVSAAHYVRHTLPPEHWEPHYLHDADPDRRRLDAHAVTRRLGKLSRLARYAPIHVARGHRGTENAYWATSAGGELLGANFAKWAYGNVNRATHSWAATDIGMYLERAGLRVYSEREFANGWTIDNEEVRGGKFHNAKPGSQSSNPDHGMRPDLAVAGDDPDYDNFVFVEVERDHGQGYSKYYKKLASYYANERVAAVWYCVDTPSIGRRIKKAHLEMRDTQRDMPVRIYLMKEGYGEYRYLDGDPVHGDAAQHDLSLIGAHTKETA